MHLDRSKQSYCGSDVTGSSVEAEPETLHDFEWWLLGLFLIVALSGLQSPLHQDSSISSTDVQV